MGNEPLSARSPLHLRLVLSAFGALILTSGAVYAFSRSDPAPGLVFLGGVAAVFAIVAFIDLYVIIARLRRHDK
ncbi:MAG: hypothetical protein H7288_23620 [Kineosporiaceae bacterium]|nr:hypothetical protein [Aeromicrobium sp.]